MPSLALLVLATSCLAFSPAPRARRVVRPLGRVAAADLDVESTSASRFGFGVTASDASDAQGIEQPVDDEWGEFRAVKIPANREEMIFAFMQYAKCERYRFRSAIVVLRDPYRAIWAEYKRHVNWREVVAGKPSGKLGDDEKERKLACKKALRSQSIHGGTLLRACFDSRHFAHHATHLARNFKQAWFHYGRLKSVHAQAAAWRA